MSQSASINGHLSRYVNGPWDDTDRQRCSGVGDGESEILDEEDEAGSRC